MSSKLDKILEALADGDKLRSEIVRDVFSGNLKAAELNYLVQGCDRIYARTETRNGRLCEVLSLNPASVGKTTRQAAADTLPAQEPTKPMRKPDTRHERFQQFLAEREAEDALGGPGAAPASAPEDYDLPGSNREVPIPQVIRDPQGRFWQNDVAVKVERRSNGKWFIVGTDYHVRVANGAAPENAEEQLTPFHADRQLEQQTIPRNTPPPLAPNPADLGLTPADIWMQELRERDRWKAHQGMGEKAAPKPLHEDFCNALYAPMAGCNCSRSRGK